MTNSNGEKPSMEELKDTIKEYVLKEFLPGENPSELTDSTPLITGGILDSLATLKLVVFLEERFHIKIQAMRPRPIPMSQRLFATPRIPAIAAKEIPRKKGRR